MEKPCEVTFLARSGANFSKEISHSTGRAKHHWRKPNFLPYSRDIMEEFLSLGARAGPMALFTAYVFGLLSSLTPCVYPLIPVTVALFGALNAERRQAFFLSLAYVLGIALVFTLLGLLAVSSGKVFGSIASSPYVIFTVSIALFFLLVLTLDLVNLRLLGRMQSWASQHGGASFGGSFIMGATSGLVAAPCVGPALVLILSVASQSQSYLWGSSLLLSYALGLGTPFLLLGTFSHYLNHLPRSGGWLYAVKGILAVGIACYIGFLLRPQIEILKTLSIELQDVGIIILLAALVGSFLSLVIGYRRNHGALKISGAVACGFLLLVTIVPLRSECEASCDMPASQAPPVWETDFEAGLRRAKEEQKPLLLDFFAEWCLACHELDQKTFRSPEGMRALRSFVLVRVDLSDDNPTAVQLSQRYGIVGLPTLLFLHPDGTEFPNTRITGFQGPADFGRIAATVRR
jgi:thioredoxin:protein disulfide reductase